MCNGLYTFYSDREFECVLGDVLGSKWETVYITFNHTENLSAP